MSCQPHGFEPGVDVLSWGSVQEDGRYAPRSEQGPLVTFRSHFSAGLGAWGSLVHLWTPPRAARGDQKTEVPLQICCAEEGNLGQADSWLLLAAWGGPILWEQKGARVSPTPTSLRPREAQTFPNEKVEGCLRNPAGLLLLHLPLPTFLLPPPRFHIIP